MTYQSNERPPSIRTPRRSMMPLVIGAIVILAIGLFFFGSERHPDSATPVTNSPVTATPEHTAPTPATPPATKPQ
jgi:hypothetical protein